MTYTLTNPKALAKLTEVQPLPLTEAGGFGMLVQKAEGSTLEYDKAIKAVKTLAKAAAKTREKIAMEALENMPGTSFTK